MCVSNPLNYQFVSALIHYDYSEDNHDIQEQIIDDIHCCNGANDYSVTTKEEIKDQLNKDSRFYQKGTCDHCGARFNFGAVYKNTLNGELLVVGNICATTHMQLTDHEVLDKRMRKAAKAARTRLANNKRIEALESPLKEALTHDHDISRSIKQYWLKWDKISEAQEQLVYKIYNGHLEHQAAIAAKPVYKGHVGNPKQRLSFKNVEIIKITGFYRNDYCGYGKEWVNVVTFKTEDNKILVVVSPSFHVMELEEGQHLDIKATVKQHKVYQGDDQTMIQRVTVLSNPNKAAA